MINVPDVADVIRADNNPVQTIFEEQVNNGEVKTIHVNIMPGTAELKAILVWTDEPGAVAAAVELVNDLDLTVSDGITTFNPWLLDPGNPCNPATTGVDSINNVEQVVIDTPAAGTYTVVVNGTSVPDGPQPYTLIVTGGSPLGQPDLVVTEKSEEWVNDTHYNVTYTVCNIGGAPAGESNTIITIDGVDVLEDPVPALGVDKCYTNIVGPFECTAPSDKIVVCADNDEMNNCMENVLECPAPAPARVPALTPIGLIALVGLLSVITAMSIKTRKRMG